MMTDMTHHPRFVAAPPGVGRPLPLLSLVLKFSPLHAATRLRLLAVVLSVLGSGRVAVAQTIVNAGFETPGNTGFTYTPGFGSLTGITGWTFGVSGGASYVGFIRGGDLGIAAPPEGSQAAFIQGTGSIAQDIACTAGTYTLSFFAQGRPGGGAVPLAISIGGVTVTFAGSSTFTELSQSAFDFVTSDPFTLTGGTQTLTLAGTVPYGAQDLMVIIDAVTIAQAVPEPATWCLFGAGAVGLILWRWRRSATAVR